MSERLSKGLADRIGAAVGTAAGGPAATRPAGLPTRPATFPPTAPAAIAPRAPVAHAVRGWAQARPGVPLMLMPGELYFGAEPSQLRTLLGSCVAMTLWHPQRRVGGMCHFLLPQRQRPSTEPLDGRYGEEAISALVTVLRAQGLACQDFTAHLYGGADTMSESSGIKFNVGERNIEKGWSLIDQHGFNLDGVDVGDHVPRTVTLNLATGDVQCRRGAPP